MKMTYIAKIQANLKRYQSVKARKHTARVLDGSYKSIHKGRSMNFDELREYVQGDDIKDIDWKASARSQKLLVRQYIAERKHNVLLVFDTNMNMLGDSDGFEEKRELAILSAGTLAYFVNKSGDYVASVFMGENGVKYFSVASGGGTGRTLHPDNMGAGPSSYGMTDTMGRMHSDAQFAGSSSVPAHVEMMGLIGMGNNPMVGATVAVAVAVEEAMK